MKTVVQRGLYFEELQPDTLYVHSPGRTVGEADNTLFTTLTMNAASLHLDAAASASTEFGQRLVNSMFTLSTLVGLSVAQLTQGTTVANLGFSEISFPLPVFVGDTLYAETTVVEKRPSKSRPDNGIVIFEHRAYNQRRQVVAIARRTALMKRAQLLDHDHDHDDRANDNDAGPPQNTANASHDQSPSIERQDQS